MAATPTNRPKPLSTSSMAPHAAMPPRRHPIMLPMAPRAKGAKSPIQPNVNVSSMRNPPFAERA